MGPYVEAGLNAANGNSVVPAKAGTHFGYRTSGWSVGPGLRRDDE